MGPSTCKQNNYKNNENNFPGCERVRDARQKASTYSCSKDVLAKALNNLDKPYVRCQPRQGDKHNNSGAPRARWWSPIT